MKYLFLSVFMFTFCLAGRAQDSTKKVKAATTYNYKPNAVNPNFPFNVGLTDIEYDIVINLRDQKVIDKYSQLFKNNNIPFTSDSWEDIVTGLYNNDSEMHHQIITSAQKDVLRIGTGGEEYQKAFLKYMLPIFSDPKRLELFLKKDEE